MLQNMAKLTLGGHILVHIFALFVGLGFQKDPPMQAKATFAMEVLTTMLTKAHTKTPTEMSTQVVRGLLSTDPLDLTLGSGFRGLFVDVPASPAVENMGEPTALKSTEEI